MITDRDIADQVKASLNTDVDDFDVEGIVDEIQRTYGPFGVADVLDIDHADFWKIVEKHAIDDDGCEGHESLNGADMGFSAECDGSCR